MLEKLLRLGFSRAICTYSIDKTADVMHQEIDENRELAVAVLCELQDESTPYPVTKANYETKLQDWIDYHAAALHHEKTQQLIAPFKAMLSLFMD